MKKVYFLVCYGAGHASMVAQVYKEFAKNKDIKIVLLGLSIAQKYLNFLNIPHKSLSDYSEIIMDKESYEFGKILADKWHVDSSGISYSESIIYLGTSMRDLVTDNGKSKAFDLIDQKGRQTFLPIMTMQKIINYESPNLILATNAPRMERASIIVGNKNNIPTINLHDDLGFMKRDYLLTGDKISVMSNITKKNLIKQGHDNKKIVVNGHPAFDMIPKELKQYDSLEIKKTNSLSNNSPCLLLGTSGGGERGKIMDITKFVCDSVQKLDDRYQLIIKPHPGDDADAYRKFAESHPLHPKVITDVNIRELLFVSEILVTFASTIMIEAALMSKPMISVNLTGKKNPLPFIKWGFGIEVKTQSQFVKSVGYILNDKEFKEKYKKARLNYFGNSIDGKASSRIVNMAYNLTE